MVRPRAVTVNKCEPVAERTVFTHAVRRETGRAFSIHMIPSKSTIVELDRGELEEMLRRVEARQLQADDYETICELIESYVGLTLAVGDKSTTIRRLRQMLFGATTEKTAAVVGASLARDENQAAATDTDAPASSDVEAGKLPVAEGNAQAAPEPIVAAGAQSDSQTLVPGHGRNGADDYVGAEKINVPHPSLSPGDPCPQCETGTVYETGRPGVVVRLIGQSPVGAKVYYLQKLRCNPCGAVFTADLPEGTGEEKYDATVGSMIALLKYGTGMPFRRAETLQASLGIPLPASTQWDIVAAQAERVEPVFAEMVQQAAQGDVLYNDDTTIKILAVMKERAGQTTLAEVCGGAAVEDFAESLGEDLADHGEQRGASAGNNACIAKKSTPERTGTFTSGIVSTRDGRRIALFFSGRQHAGENLKDVLAQRAADRPAPIQMCDALTRNLPGKLPTMLANCLAHGRRQFVEIAEQFPAECRHVLESLGVVYHNDALAREQHLTREERLLFHQLRSGPTMKDLQAWLVRQFDERRVEPNSGLGKALTYLLRHWEKLTLFLRVAGAPLDNNICERALKKAIRHRRNSLFYKTHRGAHVGDVFMSLIHTCELGKINPFDYLTELERHASEVAVAPGDWMPWNYRNNLYGASDAD
ncbi:MAG TPA: transposase [Planctomycetaceae bacterium]|jgi:transposase|nr:transposase [Planctomycetaceae bacterium]